MERSGALQFTRDLEERTEGEIRVTRIGDNRICGQLSRVKQARQGIIGIHPDPVPAANAPSDGWERAHVRPAEAGDEPENGS